MSDTTPDNGDSGAVPSSENGLHPDPDIGKRVFAVSHADDDTVYSFGFGTHEGMQPRPGSGPLWSDADKAFVRSVVADATDEEVDALLTRLSLNPRIALDNGETVWGCECWWGAEDRYQDMVAGRTEVRVTPSSQRAEVGIAEGQNFNPLATDTGRKEQPEIGSPEDQR